MLSPRERDFLLDLAWETIRRTVAGGPVPEPTVESAALLAPAAAFVSLHLGKHLRGCIGSVEARKPLWRTVREMAVAAAIEDPRFDPLTPQELDRLHVEISVLTPPAPVVAPEEILVGRDGLIVRDHGRSGVLLPQVATEWRWDREEFLRQTCRKAGLEPDAWQRDAKVFRFAAEVFARPAHR